MSADNTVSDVCSIITDGTHQPPKFQNIALFLCCHKKFPSHGYRWLNAKIQLDTRSVARYIQFFNEERPTYSLGYLTPQQYHERYQSVQAQV